MKQSVELQFAARGRLDDVNSIAYHQLAFHVHRLALFVEFPNNAERRVQNRLNATKILSRTNAAYCCILAISMAPFI